MALAKSHLFSSMVGAVGGLVYFYNRYGSIVIRSRTIPTNPSSVPQQTVRAAFSAAVSGWKSLTQAQRDLWEDFARHTPWKSSLKDDVYLTGQNMYIGIRCANVQCEPSLPSSTWDDCPCTPGLLAQPTISCAVLPANGANVGFLLNISNVSAVDTQQYSVYLSPRQSQSINYYKGPYDPNAYTCTIPVAAGAGISIPYTGLTLNNRYFWRVRALLHSDHNNMSSEQYGWCLAQPQAT